jgi:hypothetical protein
MSKVHDPSTHRLGKGAAKPPHIRIADYLDLEAARAQVPAEVVNSKNQTIPLGMYLNDKIGDCTCAGVGNTLRVNSGGATQLPDDAIQAAYVAVTAAEGNPYDPQTGANADAGCVELDVLDYWVASGIDGDRLLGHAGVDMSNGDEVKTVCWLFGSVYPGWQLSLAQQSQQIWDVDASPQGQPGSWGGHCAPIFDVLGDSVWIGTWGTYKQATLAFVPYYADEGHALISDAWLAANQGNPLINVTALQAELAKLAPEG